MQKFQLESDVFHLVVIYFCVIRLSNVVQALSFKSHLVLLKSFLFLASVLEVLVVESPHCRHFESIAKIVADEEVIFWGNVNRFCWWFDL